MKLLLALVIAASIGGSILQTKLSFAQGIDQLTAASPPSPMMCKKGILVSTGVDAEGCANPPACVQAGQCPSFAQPRCRRGKTLVDMGRDITGCEKHPVCVKMSECPSYSPPYCPDGVIVSRGRADNGCQLPPACVKPDQCPVY